MSKATSTPSLPMRSFTGTDGQTYQRRSDITLAVWFIYFTATISGEMTVYEQAAWIAYFMQRTEADVPSMTREAREQCGKDLTSLDADTFYAVREALIESIRYPASPNDLGAPTAATAPLTTPPDERPSDA